MASASAESPQAESFISAALSAKDLSDIICGLHYAPPPVADDFVAEDVNVKKLIEIKAIASLFPRCHLPSQEKIKSVKAGSCFCIKSGNGNPVSASSGSQFEERLLVASSQIPFNQNDVPHCLVEESLYTSFVFSPEPPPPTAV